LEAHAMFKKSLKCTSWMRPSSLQMCFERIKTNKKKTAQNKKRKQLS